MALVRGALEAFAVRRVASPESCAGDEQQCAADGGWYCCSSSECNQTRSCSSNSGLLSCACPIDAHPLSGEGATGLSASMPPLWQLQAPLADVLRYEVSDTLDHHWGLSLDYGDAARNGGDAHAAYGAISLMKTGYPIVASGYPLGHHHENRQEEHTTDKKQKEWMWNRFGTHRFDNVLRGAMARARRPGHVLAPDAVWMVSGGFLDWVGLVETYDDMRLAMASLLLALICISLHTRSVLLGVLGALLIALSYPLSLWVYRHVLGIPR